MKELVTSNQERLIIWRAKQAGMMLDDLEHLLADMCETLKPRNVPKQKCSDVLEAIEEWKWTKKTTG